MMEMMVTEVIEAHVELAYPLLCQGRLLRSLWAIVPVLLLQFFASNACKSSSHIVLFTATEPEQLVECNTFCQAKVEGNEDKAKVTPESYDFEGTLCCRCNYEKIETEVVETVEGQNPAVELVKPTPEVIPVPPPVKVLDPTSFTPPSQADLDQAINPLYAPPVGPGKSMNYAIIQIRGMPWQLPLNEKEVEAFVYAMNNVTGVPWQYKGAAPAVPNQIPYPPKGIPTLKDDNTPTAQAPPPPISSPVAPAVDPEVPVVVNPAVPEQISTPTRKMSSFESGRSLHQVEEYTKDYNEPTYEYEYDPYNIKYGPPPGPYGQPSPDPYAQPSPDPYAQPSPDPYAQPSPDPYAQPSPDPYAQPSPDPYQSIIPSPVQNPPPPPIPPPPPPSPPPPPPAVILPPNTNGIWYFAQYPLDDKQTKEMTLALKSQTGEDILIQSLRKSGVNSVQNLTTRFVGPEKGGIIDITKILDLSIVEAEQSTEDDSSSSSGIDGATIGIIVGAVAGGIALISLFVALLMSCNRRNDKKDKESLASQWRREREIAESESMKLDQANRPSVYKSLRWTAAQDAGFTTVSREELDRRRDMRKMDSLSASQRLSQQPVMEPTPKSSKLESMRNALGLNKTKLFGSPKPQESESDVYSPSTAIDEAEVESSRKWNVFKK